MAATTSTITSLNGKGPDASKHFATNTRFAGPLWLRPEVAEMYARAERHTGPMSRPILVEQGLNKLSIPYGRRLSILDVCCGTGVTTDRLQALLKEQGLEDRVDVTSGDLSVQQLAYLDQRIEKNGWKNTKTVNVNIEKTELPDGAFDHIICAQGIFIIPDAQAAISELYRMLKPGGTLGLANWHRETWSDDVRDALSGLPGAPNWPQDSEEFVATWAQGPWHNRHYVKSMLHARGFVDINTRTHTEFIWYKNSMDFYEVNEPFFEWVTDRYWTERERAELRPLIKDAVLRHFDNKYGVNQPFELEKVNLFATARKLSS